MPIDNTFISKIPFFSGFPPEDMQRLSAASQLKLVNPGETLAQVGETLNVLIFIAAGSLQVHDISVDGRVVGINALKAGDSFGWLQMIDGLPLTCSLHAHEAATLLLVPISTAQKYALTHPLFIERFTKILAKSLRQSQHEKAMLSLPNALHRVIVHLNQYSSNPQENIPKPSQPINNLPKQHELASIVNTSRETVSRTLQLLIRSGVLKKVGHSIVVERSDLLEKLAAEGPDALKSL